MSNKERLTLKWGTVKGWDNLSEKSQAIMTRYFDDGIPMSCAADRPSPDRKQILCELIDQLEGTIFLDWDGKFVTKEEAKEYVTNYGAKS